MENLWHAKTPESVFAALKSSEAGLSSGEAERRLLEYGPNKLPESKPEGMALIFWRQFQSPLIYILFFASLAVFAMKEFTDGVIILFVLFFNAVIGTAQEGRARNTLLALKKITETRAAVLRDNKSLIIPDEELSPGDVIFLQEGERVPADGRIFLSNNLKIDESSLTGESHPVHKITKSLKEKNPSSGDRKNMVFKGTYVVAGNGRAVVTSTGQNTAIGKISQKIAGLDAEIPLKKNLRDLSKIIAFVVLFICLLIFVLGIASGKTASEMFLTVVALAVSVIPEGLPIVITLVLASGVWRMSKRQALIKRLQAVEALGQARVIAVDKTGTLTKNEMTVQKFYAGGKIFNVGGAGYEPKGEIFLNGKRIEPLNHPEAVMAGKISAFCAGARLMYLEEEKQWRVAGDPTEAALLVLAEKIGLNKDVLEEESPEIQDIPFDYRRKFHAAVHLFNGKNFLSAAGAPEKILELSEKKLSDGREIPLSAEEKKRLEKIFLKFSEEGLRAVGLAFKSQTSGVLKPDGVKNLIFAGFLGLRDPLRPEILEATKKARAAGIRVVMITGDHKITAKKIAEEAGIFEKGDEIITGQELEKMTPEEIGKKLNKISVFARVTPDDKLKIIEAFKKSGQIVAMTGDGVNDAPSLMAADLGVAMGKIGTEVAKEASDIILLDDNFGTIVAAVEEGRSIYKTIKKVILYLFSTNLGEVLTIAAAILLGYPLPLLAAQIIWLNLVTDTFLDVSLAMEPKEDGLLSGRFEKPKRYLIDSLAVQRLLVMAVPMAVGTLWLFKKYLLLDAARAWSVSLTVLAAFQWFNAFNCRHETKSVFQMKFFGNKFLLAGLAIVISLQFLALHNPFLQKILRTAPLSAKEWGLIIIVSLSVVFFEEARKFFYRLARGRREAAEQSA